MCLIRIPAFSPIFTIVICALCPKFEKNFYTWSQFFELSERHLYDIITPQKFPFWCQPTREGKQGDFLSFLSNWAFSTRMQLYTFSVLSKRRCQIARCKRPCIPSLTSKAEKINLMKSIWTAKQGSENWSTRVSLKQLQRTTFITLCKNLRMVPYNFAVVSQTERNRIHHKRKALPRAPRGVRRGDGRKHKAELKIQRALWGSHVLSVLTEAANFRVNIQGEFASHLRIFTATTTPRISASLQNWPLLLQRALIAFMAVTWQCFRTTKLGCCSGKSFCDTAVPHGVLPAPFAKETHGVWKIHIHKALLFQLIVLHSSCDMCTQNLNGSGSVRA